MYTLAVSCRAIISSRLHFHLSTFEPVYGTTVYGDFASTSTEDFHDSVEQTAGLALYRLTVSNNLKWLVLSAKGVGHVDFPKENFRDPSLPYPKDGFGGPFLNGAKNLNKIHHTMKEFVNDLIGLSRYNQDEYQVEKFGTIAEMALKWNKTTLVSGQPISGNFGSSGSTSP